VNSRSRLRPLTDVSPADWLVEEIGEFGAGVRGLLPSRFESYARVLHPVRPSFGALDEPREPRTLRWETVAATQGRRMHRHVQFDALAGAQRGEGRDFEPDVGNLPPTRLSALSEVLAAHTASSERCWFCLWEGWSWIAGSPSGPAAIVAAGEAPVESLRVPPAFSSEVLDGPRVSLPGRDYILFEGPLRAATEMGWPSGALLSATYPELDVDPDWFQPQSPNLFWPADRTWCVATEIDLDSTYVGGSQALVESLLQDARFEAWPADLDDPIDAASDTING
jgi:hypothetical protein